jgi:hypothetical protein
MKSTDHFLQEIATAGYSFFEDMLPAQLIERLRLDIPRRMQICREYQIRNGVAQGMAGSAHHVVGGDDSLTEFLDALYLDEHIKAYFSGEYILNSYGAIDNIPFSEDAYKHGQRFHRDVRTFSRELRLMLNMLVMVHDFTIENGATKLATGTHRIEARPDDEFLDTHHVRAVGKAGTILLFDSNLWHSAAPNRTSGSRMALTLTFTRPFVKQQMDYPALLGENFPKNERLRQVLGYNSRTPKNYDEWFQPPEKRMYKAGQG